MGQLLLLFCTNLYRKEAMCEICLKLTIMTQEQRLGQPCQSMISMKLVCNFIETTLRHDCS